LKASGMLDGGGRSLPVGPQRRQRAARLVERPRLDLTGRGLEVHHKFRLPRVPQFRQGTMLEPEIIMFTCILTIRKARIWRPIALCWARVPKDRIRDPAPTSFHGPGANGARRGAGIQTSRGAAFSHQGNATAPVSATMPNASATCFCQAGTDGPVQAGFGIYDARAPGPWTTVLPERGVGCVSRRAVQHPDHGWTMTQSIYPRVLRERFFVVRRATLRVAGNQLMPVVTRTP
jgi:hypothetical protein